MTQTCKQKYNQEYYKKNKDKVIEAALLWQKENKEKVNAKNRLWTLNNPDKMEQINKKKQIKKRLSSFAKQLLHNAKNNAKKKNQVFDLVLEDIIIPEYCPLLGIKLIKEEENYIFHHIALPSLDRKDSTKGYTKDNVWVISYLANRMKADANTENLMAFANGIIACISKGLL